MHRHERNKENAIDSKEKRHCGKILATSIRIFHSKNTLSDAQRAMTAFFIIVFFQNRDIVSTPPSRVVKVHATHHQPSTFAVSRTSSHKLLPAPSSTFPIHSTSSNRSFTSSHSSSQGSRRSVTRCATKNVWSILLSVVLATPPMSSSHRRSDDEVGVTSDARTGSREFLSFDTSIPEPMAEKVNSWRISFV